MKEVLRKEIIKDFAHAIRILEKRDAKDYEELKQLSNDTIEHVALYKDLDIISVTVLLYSLYKILLSIKPEDYKLVLHELILAKQNLEGREFGAYNGNIKRLFTIIQKCDTKVKEHLQDVMQASRIKKGTVLVDKGLSIGQAAGLMGLSNWDLQQYASKTQALSSHHETIPAKKRLTKALQLFGVAQ
ncbi:hypothetical protein COV17_00460 [Candidatus Woesearchaeota archaeon CG10_big_fil_rev_8_21_14_0_10_36_11]|nr:MAG: hypothetical protein COV17_00460 [Candidatus Woesearchaeota archaeon CG10_big_fil_rev_8_21_14_0_10_36_11]